MCSRQASQIQWLHPATHAEYDVGFDAQGRIRGLRLSIWTLIGAYADASFEAFVIKKGVDMVSSRPGPGGT